jgi:hypothetical protein
MSLPLDRNADDAVRIRRNWQRLRAGALTGSIKLVSDGGIENTDSGLQLTVEFNETPTGTIDGSNAAFTLAHTPVSGTLMLYVNGILMLETGDFNISGSTVTFVSAAKPETGDWIRATYLR